MIDCVRGRAAALGWPSENVHYEHFAAPQPGLPFEVDAGASAARPVRVGEHAEPAGGDRGGGRRPALSLPRRRLRPVRDQRHLL